MASRRRIRPLPLVIAMAATLAAMQCCSSTTVVAPAPVPAPDEDAGVEAASSGVPSGLATGAPCAVPSDCGEARLCFGTDDKGTVWPAGYCSSLCRIDKNDPTTLLNPDCPGGNGTCAGGGDKGICLVACGKNGNPSCMRADYSCFQEGCLPTKGFGNCDPSGPRACPKGPVNAPPGSPEGGYPSVCVPLGPDPVGECRFGCDVFKQDCPKLNGGVSQGCYAETFYGESVCLIPSGVGIDGETCVNLNGCAPGYVCHTEKNGDRLCRKFCGTAAMVACPAGQACEALSPSVPMSVMGRCGK